MNQWTAHQFEMKLFLFASSSLKVTNVVNNLCANISRITHRKWMSVTPDFLELVGCSLIKLNFCVNPSFNIDITIMHFGNFQALIRYVMSSSSGKVARWSASRYTYVLLTWIFFFRVEWLIQWSCLLQWCIWTSGGTVWPTFLCAAESSVFSTAVPQWWGLQLLQPCCSIL